MNTPERARAIGNRRRSLQQMLRILLVAVVLAGAMFAVKEGRVLARTGLVGSCSAVAAPAGDTAEWRECRAGRLEGRPDLSRKSCTSEQVVGDVEYWRCAAPLVPGG
jgi:hypothetical protein